MEISKSILFLFIFLIIQNYVLGSLITIGGGSHDDDHHKPSGLLSISGSESHHKNHDGSDGGLLTIGGGGGLLTLGGSSGSDHPRPPPNTINSLNNFVTCKRKCQEKERKCSTKHQFNTCNAKYFNCLQKCDFNK